MMESKSFTRLTQNTGCTVLNILSYHLHYSEVKVKNLLLKRGQNKVKTKLSKVKLSFFGHPQVLRETGEVPLQLQVRRYTTKSRLLPHLALASSSWQSLRGQELSWPGKHDLSPTFRSGPSTTGMLYYQWTLNSNLVKPAPFLSIQFT